MSHSQRASTPTPVTRQGRDYRPAWIALSVCVILFLAYSLSRDVSTTLDETGKAATAGASSQSDGLPPLAPGQPAGTVDFYKDPAAGKRLAERLARQTRGDYYKLSEGQKLMISGMAPGKGPDLMRSLWEQQRSGRGGAVRSTNETGTQ